MSGALLLCLQGTIGCSGDEPVAAPIVTVTATVTASPPEPTSGHRLSTPAPRATVSTPPSNTRRPSAKQSGSSAAFKHFRVTVRQVEQARPGVRVLAEVCVRRLPPDPQGNRTRISWDPWSVSTGSKTVDASRPSSARQSGEFPADRTYRIGQCAAGWIPFPAGTRPLKIRYENGVGDQAVWDARDLAAPPTTRTDEPDLEADPEEHNEGDKPAKNYANCDALTVDYAHGVGRPGAKDRTANGSPPVTDFERSTSLYEANTDRDRDHDGIACERH